MRIGMGNQDNKNMDAVSAVIGVILMVAITVALAATIYVYTSNMMGGGTTIPTPTITFYRDESDNTLTVLQGNPQIDWQDINMTATDGINYHYAHGQTGLLEAGTLLEFNNKELTGSIVINFIHIPSNSLMGTYELHNVEF